MIEHTKVVKLKMRHFMKYFDARNSFALESYSQIQKRKWDDKNEMCEVFTEKWENNR